MCGPMGLRSVSAGSAKTTSDNAAAGSEIVANWNLGTLLPLLRHAGSA